MYVAVGKNILWPDKEKMRGSPNRRSFIVNAFDMLIPNLEKRLNDTTRNTIP
jgi:hypothetical protein